MKNNSTIEMHMSEPEKSFTEYFKEKRLNLAVWVLKRKKVYLDTNFWIMLRDVYLQRSDNDLEKDFFHLANELARNNICIFPISRNVFAEVMQQNDNHTLSATTKLIDQLSEGVSIIGFEEQLNLEMKSYLYEKEGKPTYYPRELIWTKVPYVISSNMPANPLLDQKIETAIQKAFLDHMWQISLSEMVDTIDKNRTLSFPAIPDISSKLNEDKIIHEGEHNTFKDMFLAEIKGTLDGFFERFCIIDLCETGIKNKVYNAFKEKNIGPELPGFTIFAGLHAALRWDKTHKFEKNDTLDFGHATAALPYCDYFFTEKSLCHLIVQSLKYDELYSCEVVSKPSEAVRILRELADCK